MVNTVLSFNLDCKNDCYRPDPGLGKTDAEAFRFWQADRLARGSVDFLLGATMPALAEATGMAMAQNPVRFKGSFSMVRAICFS